MDTNDKAKSILDVSLVDVMRGAYAELQRASGHCSRATEELAFLISYAKSNAILPPSDILLWAVAMFKENDDL